MSIPKRRPARDLLVHLAGADVIWRRGVAAILGLAGWHVSMSARFPRKLRTGALVVYRRSHRDGLPRAIRRLCDSSHPVPLVIVFERDSSPATRIELLEAGASEVMDQSRTPRELLARLWWGMRARYGDPGGPRPVVQGGLLRLDPDSCTASVGMRSVRLTPTQTNILWHLLSRRGEPVSSDDLRKFALYSNDTVQTSKIRNHVYNLRRRLEPLGVEVDTIPPRHYRLPRNGRTDRKVTTRTRRS